MPRCRPRFSCTSAVIRARSAARASVPPAPERAPGRRRARPVSATGGSTEPRHRRTADGERRAADDPRPDPGAAAAVLFERPEPERRHREHRAADAGERRRPGADGRRRAGAVPRPVSADGGSTEPRHRRNGERPERRAAVPRRGPPTGGRRGAPPVPPAPERAPGRADDPGSGGRRRSTGGRNRRRSSSSAPVSAATGSTEPAPADGGR